jgi:hypothetical protein
MEYINCENLKEDFSEGIKTQMFFKKLFSRARESAPSMIILDNIDEITSRKCLKDIKIRKAVYQLLRELERIKSGDRLLITAATDKPHMIEPLLYKAERFDKLLYVPMPDLETRQELFRLFLQKHRVEDDINTKILGRITKGYSGFDIKKVVSYAKHLAAEDGMGITMHYLEAAVGDIRPSVTTKILEPIKHFFVRHKRGLIGDVEDAEVPDWSEPDHEEGDSEEREDDEKEDEEEEEGGLDIDWSGVVVDEKEEYDDDSEEGDKIEDWDKEEQDEDEEEEEEDEEEEDESDNEDDEEDEEIENEDDVDDNDDENEEDENDIQYRRKWVQDDYRP